MRRMKSNSVITALSAWVILCLGVSSVIADGIDDVTEETDFNTEKEIPTVSFETTGDYYLGYRLFSSDDSLKAAEFLYPHSALVFGVNLLSTPLPYRFHLNAESLSDDDDLYMDGGFAYKDLVLFRDILIGTYHNSIHYDYQYADHTDRNQADIYGKSFTSNLVSLRLKAPDYAFHGFLNHRYVERDGTFQQRFSLGTRSDIDKVTETRDIDWQSRALTLGTNSHLGPVEFEYAYDRAVFEPGHNNILYDTFFDSIVYPHNVVPETHSSAHSIKLHSSYTGGIVTAATFSNLHQKNDYSQTKSATWKGAFDFSWIPDPTTALFFKYRHKNVDLDTPGTVRQGISYDKDILSLSARYKPSTIFTLFSTYKFSHLERKDIEEWPLLSGHNNTHSIDFRAHIRPTNKINVKASYEYTHYSEPAYNITPNNSNKFRLATTYTPATWASIFVEYTLSATERNALNYLNSTPSVVLETGDRDGLQNQFIASLTTEITPKLSLTTSWYYQRFEVEHDLAYGRWLNAVTGTYPYRDYDVLNVNESNSLSLAVFYALRDDINLGGNIAYTRSEGGTGYTDVVGDSPDFSLSSFSALKASETNFSFEITKKIAKNWEVKAKTYTSIYDDKAYDLLDGNVSTITFNIKRYF